ncbi:hypothetical protein FRX31_009639 [Thalictrum thalictroides]|uniref:Uncharacterized protein n=1 Tax=Thalictrum thalictroides TaxID=46969 RepID=A0A7J6WTP0_THATH|nr:hypothetical protein FRX31_009639 [Thalictrum thalictroides]
MGPASTSKDLLSLEKKTPTTSSLESTLLVCKKDILSQTPKPTTSPGPGKLVTSAVPKSQFLGKVKDFLPVMADANARLQHDAKEKSCMDYNIEELTGNESEYIEMDLVLGVADLHTPEAVAAAEAAMAGSQPVIPLAADCSGSDLEGSDDEDNNNGDDANAHLKACSSNKLEITTSDKDAGLNNDRGKKRKKIVELI